jgi:hypothetical protein
MDYLQFMHVMFDLQAKFPTMRWYTSEGQVHISLDVGDQIVHDLDTAKELFA